MGRAPCCDKANVKKGPWSPEEDAKLKDYIDQNGTGGNWIALPQKIESHARRLSTLNQDPKDANGIDDSLSNSALERLQLHMQLQSLQSPLSFYNNPALWPKLHPLGERILQSHYGLSHSPSALVQQAHNFQTEPYQKVGFEELPAASIKDGQANSTSSNPKQDELENSMTGFSPSDSSVAYNSGSNSMNATVMSQSDEVELLKTEFQLASGLQAELNNILFSKPSGLLQHENQITDQFECFEEFNGSKDNMLLWSNDFDTKLSSSNSWDSASVLQPGGMFQEYILGYDL
ncbi:hypothetical protein HHK36_013660 [Tetracentron sinense]|uniref:Uncharacterized protein n=1 Tax=Tetracentron sinense TaxID=13715 RepID=A0A834Z6N7_TETSI|nr:hypothetical protein HHK36_013660 [Tetracentron sinense]